MDVAGPVATSEGGHGQTVMGGGGAVGGGGVCGLGELRAEEVAGLSDVAQYGLPTPPMQRAPWTPPQSTLGNAFADAVATLCQMGLPDPRGCEYREVRVPQLFVRGEMQYRADARMGPAARPRQHELRHLLGRPDLPRHRRGRSRRT